MDCLQSSVETYIIDSLIGSFKIIIIILKIIKYQILTFLFRAKQILDDVVFHQSIIGQIIFYNYSRTFQTIL